MTGGILQLSQYGAEDILLTGNPQVSFFKTIYKRYTNFQIQSLQQTIEGNIDFGNTIYTTINKSGHLLNNIILQITLPTLNPPNSNYTYYCYTNNIISSLIKSVSVSIGGQTIDKHYGTYFDIIDELNDNKYQKIFSKFNSEYSIRDNYKSHNIYLPLQFWFCKHYSNSIPLISLLNQDVQLAIELNDLRNIVKSDSTNWSNPTTTGNDLDIQIWADYIFLDSNEQKLFSKINHEYLIEQLQYTGDDTLFSNILSYDFNLHFNHPIKEIFWIIQNNLDTITNSNTGNNHTKYTHIHVSNSDTFNTATIQINGQQLFPHRNAEYFRELMPLKTYEHIPKKHIYLYSFSLFPNQHQPSGSFNFTNVDTAILNLTFNNTGAGSSTNSKVKIYAVNYNILKIMSGQASVVYQN